MARAVGHGGGAGMDRAWSSAEASTPTRDRERAEGWLDDVGMPLRSLQLDASGLDDQILAALKFELARATAMLPQREVLGAQAHIDFALELALLAMTVGRGMPTPAMEMLSLKYSQGMASASGVGLTPSQRALFCLMRPGSRWIWAKVGQVAVHERWSESEVGWKLRLWKLYTCMDCFWHVASAWNMLLFLRHGRYSTLLERVLGMSKVYEDPMLVRSSIFGLIDQEVFWYQVSDFILFLLPSASERFTQVKYSLGQMATKGRKMLSKQIRENMAGGDKTHWLLPLALQKCIGEKLGSDGDSGDGGYDGGSGDGMRLCPICGEAPVSVSSAFPCLHPYCYYCLALHLKTFPKLSCKVCGKNIKGIAR